MKNRIVSRRNVLRGAGVCLALPWLESLATPAKAQTTGLAKRFILVFFPNGTARDFWPAAGQGAGEAWQLSPIQAPLQEVKQYTSVLTNVQNYEPFGVIEPNPGHSLLSGAYGTCVNSDMTPGNAPKNGISIDQVIAQNLNAQTPFQSLQVGWSTLDSFPDNRDPSLSRSISWQDAYTPMGKVVDPKALWNLLTAQLGDQGTPTPQAMENMEARNATNESILDYVVQDAQALKARVGYSDQLRLDAFLTEVQEVQARVTVQSAAVAAELAIPPEPASSVGVNQEPTGYNRADHADLMNDLVTLAMGADLTRVVSIMQDDARSDYNYNKFLKQRSFTVTGSTETDQVLESFEPEGLAGFHGLQHVSDSNNGFATCNYFLVEKLRHLMANMAATPEPDGSGTSVLDNTVIVYGSGMQGSQHNGSQLPLILGGGAGGALKTNYHHVFPTAEERLANVYLTIAQQAMGLTNVTSFGNSTGIVEALLA